MMKWAIFHSKTFHFVRTSSIRKEEKLAEKVEFVEKFMLES